MMQLPTQSQLLSRVWWESEAKDGHRGDEEAGHDQIVEVVHRPPSDLDGEGDVQVGLGTTLVDHLISLGRNAWSDQSLKASLGYNEL